MYRKTYIEINTDNLKDNIKELVRNYPDYEYYIGVVKGNVYGHGYKIVKHLVEAGINYLAVSTLEEAVNIRNEGLETPILCLQPIHLEDIEEAIKYNVTITISSYDYFKRLMRMGIQKELKIHLKINSGLNRLGVTDKKEVLEMVGALKKNARLEGIYSHFATTGTGDKHWDNQLSTFKEITSLINLKEIPIVHLGRSLTLLQHNKIGFCNGVRVGIIMYGYYQSSKKQVWFKALLKAIKKVNISKTIIDTPNTYKPALRLYSEIMETREIKKGDFVGYGASFKAKRNCFVGFVPIGYADGFFKKNKNGFVVINDKRYQVIQVDMGILTVLIDETVQVYNKVELMGEHMPINEVARQNNTTIYEVLCALKENIPRNLVTK